MTVAIVPYRGLFKWLAERYPERWVVVNYVQDGYWSVLCERL